MRTPRARGASRFPHVIPVSHRRPRRRTRLRTGFLFRAALDRAHPKKGTHLFSPSADDLIPGRAALLGTLRIYRRRER